MGFSRHTFVIKNDGTVWGCGANNQGQLGIGNLIEQKVFNRLDIDNIQYISSGSAHTIFLKNDGTVWGCGANNQGQLGLLQSTTIVDKPVKLNIVDAICVCCGFNYTLVLKNDGTVWGVGDNAINQISDDYSIKSYFEFVKITDDVDDIFAGKSSSFFIKTDGTVWGCGENGLYGLLGLGNTTNNVKLTKINVDNVKTISAYSTHTIFLKNDGTVWGCGDSDLGSLGTIAGVSGRVIQPVQLNIQNVIDISTGDATTIFVKNDGTIWGTGYNGSYNLGLGHKNKVSEITQMSITDVKEVSAQSNFTSIMKNNSELYFCGIAILNGLANTLSGYIQKISKVDGFSVNFLSNQQRIKYVIKYVFKQNGIYKTINNDMIEDLGIDVPTAQTIIEKGCSDLNKLIKNNLLNNTDILIYYEKEPTKVYYSVLAKPEIIKPKGDIILNNFSNIDKFEIIQSLPGIVKMAVSFDKGKTWKTFKENNWQDITLDLLSLKENGIDPQILKIIPSILWDVALVDKTIRFSYYLENTVSERPQINTLSITGDLVGQWEKAGHCVDYKSTYINNTTLQVSILTDGTYKINY